MNKQPHVLVIEDTVIAQVAESAVLEELGCSVTLATTGKEAIQKTEHTPHYDIILLDLGLPDIDALTVMENITISYQKANKKSPPVIALTAYADKSLHAQCTKAGMVDFLAKPLTPAMARHLLQKYLQA